MSEQKGLTDVWCVVWVNVGVSDPCPPDADQRPEGCCRIEPDAVAAMRKVADLLRVQVLAVSTPAECLWEQILKAAAVPNLVIHPLQSDELGVGRPQPAYVRAIVEAKGYDASAVGYVTDQPGDVEPALKSGMRPVLIAPSGAPPVGLPKGVPVIQRPGELPDLLAVRAANSAPPD